MTRTGRSPPKSASTSLRARTSNSIASRTSHVLARPGLDSEEPNLEVGRGSDEDGGARIIYLLERLPALVRLRERLGTREHRLDPAALVGRDSVLEEVGVDP